MDQKTQRRMEKGQKLGRPEAIQTCDAFFQRYHCLSVSACNIRNELSNLLPKIIHTIIIFSYIFWGLGHEVFNKLRAWSCSKKFGN